MNAGGEQGSGGRPLALAGEAGASVGALSVPPVVWLSDQGLEVRFASRLDSSTGDASGVGRVLVSPGTDKSSPQVADVGQAVVVAWQETAESGHGAIKLRGISADAGSLGREIIVGSAASELSHHSLFMSGYGSNPIDPADASDTARIDVVWVASDSTDEAGVGRIMLQRFGLMLNENGDAPQFVPIALAGQDNPIRKFSDYLTPANLSDAANDNAIWVDSEDGAGGAMGRMPTAASLQNGDVLVAWIGAEGHVHGKLYPHNDTSNGSASDYEGINTVLADLTHDPDRDGDGHSIDARRVKVAELGPGSFAIVWLVAAGADAMLNGSVFSMPNNEGTAGDGDTAWVQSPVAPLTLPNGFTGEFAVNGLGAEKSGLSLTYEITGGSEAFSTKMVTVPMLVPEWHSLGPDHQSDAKAGNAAYSNGHAGSSFATLDEHSSFLAEANSLTSGEGHNGASTAVDAQVTAEPVGPPVVTANSSGMVVAWTVHGSTEESVGIRIKIFDAQGDAATAGDGGEGAIIDVTDSADPDVSPAVVHLGGGGAVAAWVESVTGTLRTQVYTSQGTAQGPAGGLVVDSGHKISDLTIATQPDRDYSHGPAENGEQEAQSNEFALAWVEDRDDEGYGNIMLQRYAVPNGGSGGQDSTPVALGRDGHAGDADDAAEPFTVETDEGPSQVVGRAPQLVGLHDGQLAIGWVEQNGSDETVKGAVIERDGGQQVLSFDLSQLGDPATVAKGTQPVLSASSNNDILVAWLDPDGKGGFDVKAALYKSVGPDAWSLPDKVLELHHFDSQPKSFSVALTPDATPSLLVTWENSSGSSRTYGQYFSTDGDASGDAFTIRGDDHAGAGSAMLPDGQIVVVYAEKDKNGRIDIESHTVETASLNVQATSSNSSGETNSGSPSLTDTADHIFGDRGTLDTHSGLGDYASLSGSPHYALLASNKDITVGEDATDGVIVDVLDDQLGSHLRVVQINGEDITIGAPLRVEHGFVQLRDDGDLLFTADEHFHGTISFAYTVSDEDDRFATASVSVNVTPVDDDPMPLDLGFDDAAGGDTQIAPYVFESGKGNGDYLSGGNSGSGDDGHGDTDRGPHSGPGDGTADAGSSDRSGPGDGSRYVEDGVSRSGSEGGVQVADYSTDTAGSAGNPNAAVDASGSNEGYSSGPGSGDIRAQLALVPASTAGTADTIEFASGSSAAKPERQWLHLDYNDNTKKDSAGHGHGRDGEHRGHGVDNDTFVFHAAFGNEAASDIGGPEHVVDLSNSGYETFQALKDSGALVQVGADVEITLSHADAAHPEKILLRSVSLSDLSASDFKFG